MKREENEKVNDTVETCKNPLMVKISLWGNVVTGLLVALVIVLVNALNELIKMYILNVKMMWLCSFDASTMLCLYAFDAVIILIFFKFFWDEFYKDYLENFKIKPVILKDKNDEKGVSVKVTKNIEKNIEAALNEEIRQYEVIKEIFSQHSTRIELLFGFLGAIFAYLFTQQGFIVISYPQAYLFWGGVSIVFAGGVVSFWAYRQRAWYVGSDMVKLLKDNYNTESCNFKLKILKDIHEDNKQNSAIVKNKSTWSKIGYILIFMGFLAIAVSKLF